MVSMVLQTTFAIRQQETDIMNKTILVGSILIGASIFFFPYEREANLEIAPKYLHEEQIPETVEPEQKNEDADTKYVDSQERECLAKTIYWEARNQSLEGRLAVGFVVLNRVNSGIWGDSVCQVVYHTCQFSWVCNSKAKRDLYSLRDEKEQIAWAESIAIANELMIDSSIEDKTSGAIYFHSHRVSPSWSRWKKIERTVAIEDHVFYRVKEM